jgi:hypothetical protein
VLEHIEPTVFTAADVAALQKMSGVPLDPARHELIASVLSASRSAAIVRTIDVDGVPPALTFDPRK